MRYVCHIASQPPYNRAKLHAPLHGVIGSRQLDGLKISRQRTALRHLRGRPYQVVSAVAIESSQRPHHIADICPNAELRHPPDVDGDFHEENLTIPSNDGHSEFTPMNVMP